MIDIGRGVEIRLAYANNDLVRHNILCLRSFLTLLNIERHLLTFSQTFKAVALNGREMHEHVVTSIIRRNKAEALGVVEPFYCTCSHNKNTSNLLIKYYCMHVMKGCSQGELFPR